LIIAANQSPRPVQRDGDKKFYIIIKAAPLQGGAGQEAQNRIQFGPVIFEAQYHFLQALGIDAGSSYLVKTYFFALAIRAETFQHGEFTDISAAAWAVIGTCAGQKLVPAILAQAIVGFADTFAAIDADWGPKELV